MRVASTGVNVRCQFSDTEWPVVPGGTTPLTVHGSPGSVRLQVIHGRVTKTGLGWFQDESLHQSPGGDEVFNSEIHSDNKARLRLKHALKKVKKESYKVEL